MENYEQGDDLYVFGFSRGGYAAMNFVGLLRSAGVLRREEGQHLPEAYSLYCARNADYAPDAFEPWSFRTQRSHTVEVKCLGLWDTVGGPGHSSLGRLSVRDSPAIHDVRLTRYVRNAFHALAINEHRRWFAPILYDAARDEEQRLEQVWFAGAHSDVGGGASAGLSDIALKWMIGRAGECGLDFDPEMVQRVLSNDADRVITDSRTGHYRLIRPHMRPIGTCRSEAVHGSVAEIREAAPDRFPLTIVNALDRLPTAS